MKSSRFIFVTGTDTDVGKTVFAADLTRTLIQLGARVVALKPICSGGRDDARKLRLAAGNALSLDDVNPWHFRAALSPDLAARREKKHVRLAALVAHAEKMARRYELVVVEGAGGLLSPLGEGFDSRDLIVALRARPIIVCPNRLGAVNQVRLVLEALPVAYAKQARIVLVNPPRADAPSRSNRLLLAKFFPVDRIFEMPWLKRTRTLNPKARSKSRRRTK